MAYQKSFGVPVGRMSITDQKRYVQDAIDQGVAMFMDLKLTTSVDNVSVRLLRANADFGLGTVLENEWRFNLVAANNAAAINWAARRADQIVVVYGCDNYDIAPCVTLITWRTAAAGGTTKMMIDTQISRGYMESGIFFSQPVVYGSQEDVIADIQADNASATQQLAIWGFIVEKRGTVLS